MSGKPTELGYKKDTGRCKFCQAVILWGYMFGKKHPYDVTFDDDGTPHKAGSHMDTCPNWKSQGAKARADAHTEATQNWRLSCEAPKPHDPIDAKTVVLFDVPEKHATPIALKLVEKGSSVRVLAPRCPHSALQEDSRQRYPRQSGTGNTSDL